MLVPVFFCLAWLTPLVAADFDSHVKETVQVAMRDGVALATDVYRPARRGIPAEGRFPVLLARSPYNKAGERGKAEFFARHGYVFVAQDCRGFFASPGRFAPMAAEGPDGFDAIEWAAAQPWSNGRVGTLGASYLAMVQYAALVERPPHLEAVYAAVGPTDFYRQAVRRGGAPGAGSQVWVFTAAARRTGDAGLRKRLEAVAQDPREWLLRPFESRLELFGDMEEHREHFRQQYLHASFDAYWRQPGYWAAGHTARMKDVPMLLVSGWYDSFAEATLALHQDLTRRQRTPKRLIMGSWPHAYGKRECGEAIFPEEAALDERPLQLAWFDRWLKDRAAPDLPPVKYFVMGGGPGRQGKGFYPGGEWRESAAWPPPGARQRVLYLSPDGALAEAAPRQQGRVEYPFEPRDPPPVRGGRYRNGCIVDLDAEPPRTDTVRFSARPLAAPLVLAGPVHVELEAATSARDADFVVRLVDVWPDGYAMPVAEGLVRLSRRDPQGRGSRIVPGRKYAVTVDLGATALHVPAGHRLRLEIASGAFPAIEPNRGTGEPESRDTGFVSARQTVFTGGRRPSRLLFTVAGQREAVADLPPKANPAF
jgi:putative CocE/NonD family hydrolase